MILRTHPRQGGISRETLHAFIAKLAIPEEAKQPLMQMTPHNYIGKAAELAARI